MLLLLFAVAPFVTEPLPEGAVARLGSLRGREGLGTVSLAYSPDGRLLASGGSGGTGHSLRVWDLRTGELHPAWRAPGRNVTGDLAFLDGGRRLLVASQDIACLDVATGRELPPLGRGYGQGASFAADWFAVPSWNTIVIREFPSGKQSGLSLKHPAMVIGLAARPGTPAELASIDRNGTLIVWDVRAGRERWRAAAHTRTIHGAAAGISGEFYETMKLAYDPRGRHLASAGSDGTVRLWSPDGRPGRVLSLGDGRPSALAFGPSGRLAVGFEDGTVRVYDADAGRELRRWTVVGGRVRAVAFAPAGDELAAGSWYNAPTRWDVRTGRPIGLTQGHAGPVQLMRFLPGGRLVSVGHDRAVIDWDLRTRSGRGLRLEPAEEEHPWRALSPDGRTVATATLPPGLATLFDATTGRMLRRLRDPDAGDAATTWVAFHPAGRRVVTHDTDGAVRCWDVASGRRLWAAPGVGPPRDRRLSYYFSLEVSPAGDRVLALGGRGGEKGALWLLDAATGAVIHSLGAGSLSRALFTPDGRSVLLVYQADQPTIRWWDVRTGTTRPGWEVVGRIAELGTFSPDGRLLASQIWANGDEHRVVLREVETGQAVREWPARPWLESLAFAADGRTLATGGPGGEILLWDVTGRAGRLPASASQVQAAWAALAGHDGRRAFDAAWSMASSPAEAVALLARRLPPRRAMDAGRLRALIERLDSDEFASREAAERELASFGPGASVQVGAALAAETRLEVRRRLQRVRSSWEASAEVRRQRRALMILEQAGTADAVGLLRRLAAGVPGADLTDAAKAAVGRLAQAR